MVRQLLPIEPPTVNDEAAAGNLAEEYIFEPSPDDVLARILPRYIEMQIYEAILQNAASFQSAQMVAMKNATDNANDVIYNLTLLGNKLRQAGVSAPERETFEAALKSGRQALESLGLGAYEARERADLFRRFNIQLMEEMVEMAEIDASSRAAAFKRTSAMLTEIINEDRNHLSVIQRHGWQGTEEGKHSGNPEDEPEVKPTL